MSELLHSESPLPLEKPDRNVKSNIWVFGIYIALWLVGVIILAVTSFVVHGHPASWPIEVETAQFLQGARPFPCNYDKIAHTWLDEASDWLNKFNDPLPGIIIPVVLMLFLIFIRRFWQAICFIFAVASVSLLWVGLSNLVARTRATPRDGFCVHRNVQAGSFPSGHVTHDMVLYGFLFYIMLQPSARKWKYHWLLVVLQILMVIYVLLVGYARLEAGEHHLFDVLAAYLFSLLWLGVCIALYQFAGRWLAQHLPWKRVRENIATTLA